MHHKKTKTSSREFMRRADMKSYRQQEQRALDNLDEGIPEQPRAGSWSYRPELLPLGDAVCNGKRHGRKKPRKPKDKCPAHHKHEWYKEWITREHSYRYPWMSEGRSYTTNNYVATCIHCWKEKILKREYDYGRKRYPRRALPRTAYRRPKPQV